MDLLYPESEEGSLPLFLTLVCVTGWGSMTIFLNSIKMAYIYPSKKCRLNLWSLARILNPRGNPINQLGPRVKRSWATFF